MEAEDFENIIENKIDITEKPKPKAKPKKKLSELQLETIRRNMMLGRKKRAENIAKKKQTVHMARSETLHTMTKDEETDSDSDYEELVIQAPQPKQQQEQIDNDVMSKLMADMAFIKDQLNKQEGKGQSPTIVNVQVPPQPVQPAEPAEAVNQRKRILMNFGR